MHMYTNYNVSTSNSVPGEVCTDDDDANANDNHDNDDGQCMIV